MHVVWILVPAVFLPLVTWAADATPAPTATSKGVVRPVWINFALGGGRPGVAGAVNVTWQSRGDAVFQLGVENNQTFSFMGTPKEAVTSVGLLMGFRTPPALASAALLAGPAWVGGFHRGQPQGYSGGDGLFGTTPSYEKERFNTAGLMANAQLFWKPLDGFGLGIQGNACWNRETSTTSVLVSLQLGTTR